MYTPEHFREQDLPKILALIDRHPLASIVTHRRGEFDANHLPLLVESDAASITLIGHVSRNNRLWSESQPAEQVLVLFRGAEGYISPNWYPGKQRDENQVPTWNYQTVNLRGELEVIDDEKFVRGVVARLVTRHERTQPKPWKITDSEPTYIRQNLAGIVGIRIRVTSVEAKYKLSQNRTREDGLGAAQGVGHGGNAHLETAMREELE